jgi:coenzyme PQQ precursor peptide PqqA
LTTRIAVAIRIVQQKGDALMKKTWSKPAVSATETSLEVTAYLPAELK